MAFSAGMFFNLDGLAPLHGQKLVSIGGHFII